LDPSKLKPETISKISALLQELPPAQLQKIQSIIHNQIAGFDVSKEIQELESQFPPGFREKMARLMYEMHGVSLGSDASNEAQSSPGSAQDMVNEASSPHVDEPKSIDEARLTILKGVASGAMSPEEAFKVLFPKD
jgi:hypothetical protein